MSNFHFRHGRKFSERLSKEEVYEMTQNRLSECGVDLISQASFTSLLSQEVVGNNDFLFASLQPQLKLRKDPAWRAAFTIALTYLKCYQMNITLNTMMIEKVSNDKFPSNSKILNLASEEGNVVSLLSDLVEHRLNGTNKTFREYVTDFSKREKLDIKSRSPFQTSNRQSFNKNSNSPSKETRNSPQKIQQQTFSKPKNQISNKPSNNFTSQNSSNQKSISNEFEFNDYSDHDKISSTPKLFGIVQQLKSTNSPQKNSPKFDQNDLNQNKQFDSIQFKPTNSVQNLNSSKPKQTYLNDLSTNMNSTNKINQTYSIDSSTKPKTDFNINQINSTEDYPINQNSNEDLSDDFTITQNSNKDLEQNDFKKLKTDLNQNDSIEDINKTYSNDSINKNQTDLIEDLSNDDSQKAIQGNSLDSVHSIHNSVHSINSSKENELTNSWHEEEEIIYDDIFEALDNQGQNESEKNNESENIDFDDFEIDDENIDLGT